MTRVALRAPSPAGLNWTVIVQEAFACTEGEQFWLGTVKSVEVPVVMPEMVRGPAPEFVNVICWVGDEPPCTVPNERFVGVNLIAGKVASEPVPVSGMVWSVVFAALS